MEHFFVLAAVRQTGDECFRLIYHSKTTPLQEVGKFARRCAKDGGFFKCCVSVWNLNCWEMARNKLVKEGLIAGNITKNCKRRKRDPCVVCKAEGVCTMRNILTGQVWIWKIK